MTRERGRRAPDPLAVRQRRVRLVLSQAALAQVVTQGLRVGSLADMRRRLDAGEEVPPAAEEALQKRALRGAVSETQVRAIERDDRVQGEALLPVLVWLRLHPAPDAAGPSSGQAAGDWLRELRERFGISRSSLCNHATGIAHLGVKMTNLSDTTLIDLETSARRLPGAFVMAKVVRGLRAHGVPIEHEHVVRAFAREADDEGAWAAGEEKKVRKTIAGTAASGTVPDGGTLAHSHDLAQSVQGARHDRSRKKSPRESSQPAVGVLTPEFVDLFAMLRALNAIRS